MEGEGFQVLGYTKVGGGVGKGGRAHSSGLEAPFFRAMRPAGRRMQTLLSDAGVYVKHVLHKKKC